MPGHAAERFHTVEEFLAHEGEPDVRYELVDGRIVAMAPPSVEHSAIAINVGTVFRTRLTPPCRPYVQAGIRVPERNDLFYEADLAVSSAGRKPGSRWLSDPILIVEILSPSTRSHDRGQKVPDYMTIPSVREILLIDSERRHAVLISRVPEGWLTRDIIGEGAVPLETVPGGITLEEIYGE